MSKFLQRFKLWRSHRQQLSLARWAEERAKGRWRFVVHQAFIFAVLMTAFSDVYDHFFHEGPHVFHFRFDIVQYVITGIFVGYVGWGDREGKYKNAQINGRLRPVFDDRNLPR